MSKEEKFRFWVCLFGLLTFNILTVCKFGWWVILPLLLIQFWWWVFFAHFFALLRKYGFPPEH